MTEDRYAMFLPEPGDPLGDGTLTRVVLKKETHRCVLPAVPSYLDIGSEWTCHCGAEYVLTMGLGLLPPPYPVWKRIADGVTFPAREAEGTA